MSLSAYYAMPIPQVPCCLPILLSALLRVLTMVVLVVFVLLLQGAGLSVPHVIGLVTVTATSAVAVVASSRPGYAAVVAVMSLHSDRETVSHIVPDGGYGTRDGFGDIGGTEISCASPSASPVERSRDHGSGTKSHVEKLVAELRALWVRSGRPRAWTMAEKTGVPAGRFEFLFCPYTVIPDWDEVVAVLRATGEDPRTLSRWELKWANAVFPHDPAARRNSNLGRVTVAATRRPHVEHTRHTEHWPRPEPDGPLGKALQSQDAETFVEQLRALRESTGLSFDTISVRTNKRLPKSTAHWMVQAGNFPAREQQVRDFVTACDANESEADLWVTTYLRAWKPSRTNSSHRDNTRRPDACTKKHCTASGSCWLRHQLC